MSPLSDPLPAAVLDRLLAAVPTPYNHQVLYPNTVSNTQVEELVEVEVEVEVASGGGGGSGGGRWK